MPEADAVVRGPVFVWQVGAATLPRREPGGALEELGDVPWIDLWRFIRENNLSLELLDRD